MLQLKAGKYFIGDPCYVIKDELWDEYCEESFKLDNGGVFKLKGVEVFFSSTQYGDGSFEDDRGNLYSVDSGLIGATPLDAGITDESNLGRFGLIIDIKEDFYCEEKDDKGVITIHDYMIDTGCYEDDSDDDYDEW